jgi:predicted porin
MKKILLCSAALVGVAFAAAPAMAQVDVTVGGHTKNYFGYADNDDDAREWDMLRESEIHFNAEGTADNGLTYGFHVETEADGDDSMDVEESYLYLASNLGRLNLGSEDGAAYLLQVAAPSADANIDGLRQYINPFSDIESIDYDNDATGTSEKVTYLSPNWNGLQLGVSYTPSIEADTSGLEGFSPDDDDDFYEGAVRYEGTFNNIGFALGGGYGESGGDDDFQQWNVGADFDIGAFGVGAAYTEEESDDVVLGDSEQDTIVVGADYTTGPFQFGVSYLNLDGGDDTADADRYAAGVVYTLTQGLTLRGSVQYVDADDDAAGDDEDATAVLGGIQFNF